MRALFSFVAILATAAGLVVFMNSISLAQTPSTGIEGSATTESVTALAKANNRFAVDLLHKLSASSADNAFFSPYSV